MISNEFSAMFSDEFSGASLRTPRHIHAALFMWRYHCGYIHVDVPMRSLSRGACKGITSSRKLQVGETGKGVDMIRVLEKRYVHDGVASISLSESLKRGRA